MSQTVVKFIFDLVWLSKDATHSCAIWDIFVARVLPILSSGVNCLGVHYDVEQGWKSVVDNAFWRIHLDHSGSLVALIL